MSDHTSPERQTHIEDNLDETRDYLEQAEALKKLHAAQRAEDRVTILANLLDKKSVDVLVGLIPVLGDAGIGLLITTYLLIEGKLAGVPNKDLLKIIGHQMLDTGAGSVPIVGDIIDYFNKANLKSLHYFKKNKTTLIEQAQQKGVSKEKINELIRGGEKLQKQMEWVVQNKHIKKATTYSIEKLLKKKD